MRCRNCLVEALAADLRERVVGRQITRVDVAAISALKTFDPPPTALHGREVTGAGRFGKFSTSSSGDVLIVHLSRAAGCTTATAAGGSASRAGPIALQLRGTGGGFDLRSGH
jgi:formamidopyrimidine-DNA glycosylase